MTYLEFINTHLKPNITEKTLVLDLFAGCGGLSLGFEAAGFETIGYECVEAAVNTYNRNLKGHCYCDMLTVGYEYPDAERIGIVIGGPPCQPFSRIGSQRGMEDARDGFPIFIDAVRRIQPKVFLFENVQNILGRHKWYLDLIIQELKNLGYIVEYRVLNAVNYGVPQNRERLITIGYKSSFHFPREEKIKVTVGEAIGDLMYRFDENSKFLSDAQDRYIAAYEAKSGCLKPRDLYPDAPARTLTCRNLAGATSDMHRVRLKDGRRRRITQREAARLQSFPDWFEFSGNETKQFTQIGNAVPPVLAYKLALAVKDAYYADSQKEESIIMSNKMSEDLLLFEPGPIEQKKTTMRLQKTTPNNIRDKVLGIIDILREVGVPFDGLTPLRIQRMAQACMAIGGIKESFKEVKSVKDGVFLRTREILSFENEYYGEKISPGSYDDIRRKGLKLLVLANIAISSSAIESQATNDGSRGYCLSDEFAALLIAYNTPNWEAALTEYKQRVKALEDELEKKREAERVPVTLPSGKRLVLSYGEHNQLQKAIIEQFLAIFGKGCEVLYVGDTKEKLLHKEEEKLKELGFFDLDHDELPDVIAYNKEKNLLFLIEAFHCTGQWDKTRLYKVKQKLVNCNANLIFVSAFENLDQFRTKSNDIAWETEVWIADLPEHMIHFNGWKFLEIHK